MNERYYDCKYCKNSSSCDTYCGPFWSKVRYEPASLRIFFDRIKQEVLGVHIILQPKGMKK